MKDVLDFILENYSTENGFKNNNVANYLRAIAKETIEKDAVIDINKYKVEGSPGKGNWAEIPWIGVFDKKITTTATKGFYIVYLFTADMGGVYLSLNQGWTFFEDNYRGQDPREKIRVVSNSFRKKLNSGLSDFPDEKIDLRSNYKLAKGYELGHICGRFYLKNKIPEDAELINDLRNLIGVYRELIGIVGNNYENIVKDFLSHDIGKFLETKKNETELEIELLEEIDSPVSPEKYREYKEGQKKLKQHIIRERNSQVIDEAKKNFKLKNKRVFCEICGFDFENKYGEVGKNFIEGHHKLPISKITEEFNKITSKDIALVCSNCHKMLHRKRPWLTVEDLKRLIK